MLSSISSTIPRQTALEKTLVFESFQLSVEEELEVNALNKNIKDYSLPTLTSLATSTSNAGIQYTLIDYSDLVLVLIANKDLHPKVALAIANRLSTIGPWTFRTPWATRVANMAANALVKQRVVANDASLMKLAWEVAEVMNQPDIAANPSSFASSLLFDALLLHSSPSHDTGEVMSIDTLLLLLSYINKLDEKHVPSPLYALRARLLKGRRDEIKAWVKINMPDYSGLPISWVLEVFDLYV